MDPGTRPLNGYADRMSVRPGETIRFHVSCAGPATYCAGIVRLHSADDNPAGAPFRSVPVETPVDGPHEGSAHVIHAGSHAVVPASPHLVPAGAFTLQALVMPTTPQMGRQGIIGTWSESDHTGASLIVGDDGAAGLVAGNGHASVVATTGEAMVAGAWYRIAAILDPEAGTMRLFQQALDTGLPVLRRIAVAFPPVLRETRWLMAAWHRDAGDGRGYHAGCFNGRIEAPRVACRAFTPDEVIIAEARPAAPSVRDAILAAWDFSRGIDTLALEDVSGHGHHGTLVHLPERAVTGATWSGREMSWRHRPEDYAAIHFHDDDIHDAGWPESHAWQVPEGTPSAIHALHVTAGDDEDFIPFAVVPPRGRRTSDVCFLMPTATYMAYANSGRHFRNDTVEMKQFRATVMTREDCFLQAHSEYGLSTYDTHSDGSGVSFSSRLRPVLNLRPKGRVWGLVADTHITSWLEQASDGFDVVTDEELHGEGLAVLEGYSVVVTGSHPEYHTAAMLDALGAWLARGGRLIYTGANGFYWRIALRQDLPGVLECRKTEGGTRSWVSRAGESFMSLTGEYGGLWRRSGRPPQQLAGIGFTAQGFDRSTWYRRTPAADDPRAAFIFAGIDDEIIGDAGLVGGGAAGLEIDRADTRLGTPPHALIVARSEEHAAGMLVVLEELTSNQPVIADDHPLVRADMTFFEHPGGGAVFSAGSIAFGSALPVNGYDNPVARLLGNVLERFRDPEPFAMPAPAKPRAEPGG